MLKLSGFFYSRRTLVATFNENRAHTSKKNVVKQTMDLSKPSQKHELFQSHSSDFDME